MIFLLWLISACLGTFVINEAPTPIFSTLIPDQAYVVQDGSTSYKFYYGGEDFASINVALSTNGVDWTPYSGNPIITDGQYHTTVKYYAEEFVGSNVGSNASDAIMHYRIWYCGPTNYLLENWRYGESADGIIWVNRIPVSGFGTPVWSAATGVAYGITDAVYNPNATNTGLDWAFRLYANVQWVIGIYAARELVIVAFSPNGYNWTGYDPTGVNYSTPIFYGTLNTSDYDCDHIGWFKVQKNAEDDWEAIYSGGCSTTYKAPNGIGYAISSDGFNWTRAQTVLTTADPVEWRNASVWMPSFVKTEYGFKLWFIGSDNINETEGSWIWWKLGYAIMNETITTPPLTSGAVETTLPPTVTPADGTLALLIIIIIPSIFIVGILFFPFVSWIVAPDELPYPVDEENLPHPRRFRVVKRRLIRSNY